MRFLAVMVRKYCSHLFEQGHDAQADHYMCKITKDVCVASTFENSDPGHPASYEVAEYLPYLAELCPAFNVPDPLVEKIREYFEKK
jgi:hypothetical protein